MRDWGITRKDFQAMAGERDALSNLDRDSGRYTGLPGRLNRSERRTYRRAYRRATVRGILHAARNS